MVCGAGSIALADERTEARRHFRRGMELVVEGQIDAAVLELEIAYQILPHPNVLYNIGRAYAEGGRYEEALDYFARYLETSPADADEVRGYVAALEARIASRAASATAAVVPTPTETVGGASESDVARGTPAEIAELRATADRLTALAGVVGGTELPARAASLRALADRMERANATPPTTTSTTETVAAQTTTDVQAPSGDGIALASADTELYEERFVSSTRAAVDPLDAPNSTTIITRQDIRLTGITALGELLRRVAGVQVMTTNPAETNVGIRGFNRRMSPRVLLLINGRSTYVDPLGVTVWQQQPVSVEDIERIEVVRGPASALYGANGFSGIVNVITRTPGDEPGTEFEVRAGNGGQYRAYAGTNVRSGDDGRLGFRMSASYDQADRFSNGFERERVDIHLPTTASDPDVASRQIRAYANLTYRLGRSATIYAEGGANYMEPVLLQASGIIGDSYLRGTAANAVAGVQSDWGGLRFFWNTLTADIDQWGATTIPLDVKKWNTFDLEGTFAHQFDTGVVHQNIVAGGGYRRKYVDWNVFTVGHHEDHFQVFVQDSIRFGERLTLVAGLRMDRHPLLDRPVFSPRAAIVGRVGERQAIRASVSTAFRTPAFLESYLSLVVPTSISAVAAFVGGSEVYHDTFGTTRIRPERILSTEVGYQYAESDRFSLDAVAYFNRVDRLLGTATDSQLITLASTVDPAYANVNQFSTDTNTFVAALSGFQSSTAANYLGGFELVGRLYPVDGLDVYANYSFTMSFIDDGANWSRTHSAPSHQLNTGVQYRHALSTSVGLDVAFDLHVQSATYWDEQSVSGNRIANETIRLDPLYMTNARVGIRLLDDRLSLGIVGYNLNALFGPDYRQHPLTQPVAGRVMGSVAYRF